jgi:iron complex outermembrane receptor protein
MNHEMPGLTAKAMTLVLGAAILSVSGRAAADSDSPGSGESDTLQEIMVTAQKRSERLQDVPIAVEALTAAAIESSGIDTTKDLADLVPGLSFRETYNQLQPHLRGVGTEAAGPGSESPVGVYIDDVYYASAVATDMELNDISQVTVLKGPQGTLFGRNTTGGVIQVTTKDPTQDTKFEVGESFGSYRDSVTDLYLSGGLAKDLAASFTARYETQGEGWGRNLYTGSENHKVDSDVSVRGKLVYTPSTDVTLKIGADYSDRVDSMGPNFRPYSTSLISPGLLTVPYVASSNPWDTDSNFDNHNHFHQDGVSANIDVNLGFAHWIDIAAWRQDNLSTQFSPTGTPTPGTNINISEQTHQFTEEMRLVSPSSDVFNWVGGLFFFDGHGDTDPLSLELYPNSTGAPFPINAVIVTTENTKSVAGYLQNTARIFEDTHLKTAQ